MLAGYDTYVDEVKTYERILQNSEDVCEVNWSVCHVAVYVCRDTRLTVAFERKIFVWVVLTESLVVKSLRKNLTGDF